MEDEFDSKDARNAAEDMAQEQKIGRQVDEERNLEFLRELDRRNAALQNDFKPDSRR